MLLAASLHRAQQGTSSGTGGKAGGPRAKAAAPNISAHQVSLAFLDIASTFVVYCVQAGRYRAKAPVISVHQACLFGLPIRILVYRYMALR